MVLNYSKQIKELVNYYLELLQFKPGCASDSNWLSQMSLRGALMYNEGGEVIFFMVKPGDLIEK
jgi:hypothetical protein